MKPDRFATNVSTPRFRIRRAKLNEESVVHSCVRQAFEKYVARIGKEPAPMTADFARQIESGFVDVAEVNGEIVACVTFFPVEDHMHLANLAVRPDYSGQGIGKTLIKHVEQAAIEAGHVAVELYTNEAMLENLAMYPKLGYKETGRRTEEGYHRVYFRKAIR